MSQATWFSPPPWVVFWVGATSPLSSVGWCCSTQTKKGKHEKTIFSKNKFKKAKQKQKEKKSFKKDLCRKRGFTSRNHSIWAFFPDKFFSLFFFFRIFDTEKREKERKNKDKFEKKKKEMEIFKAEF